MDNVDVEIEDINELEARLYAQIHHEAAATIAENYMQVHQEQDQRAEKAITTPTTAHRIVTATSVINRPGKNNVNRYWSSGVAANNNTNNTTITIKTNNANNTTTTKNTIATTTASTGNNEKINDTIENKINSEGNRAVQVNVNSETSTEMTPTEHKTLNFDSENENDIVADTEAPTNSKNSNLKIYNTVSTNTPKQQKQMHSKNQDLRINPFAAKANLKKHHQQQQHQKRLPPLPPNMLKDGPFAQQAQKLQKAMRIEVKKQKSKNAQVKNKRMQVVIETIKLDSTDEDFDDNDVIVLPVEPPPIITVDDSSEEEVEKSMKSQGRKRNEKQLHAIEENAMDAADVKMINFAKPHMSLSGNDSAEKVPENSSRCASPCASVLSSDDFIVQSDRSRLLDDNCVADDEDLVLLSADMDNLLNAPNCKNQQNQLEAEKIGVNGNEIGIVEDSTSNEPAIFVGPTFASASSSCHKYRVEQTQFRALDVYESESDITDSVYSKGQKSSTIIRAIRSSSDENIGVDDFGSVQKTKRLRKRRSSSNKGVESETNIDAAGSNSTDSDEGENDGVNSTGVPFIARGPAVERCKTKSSRTATDFSRSRRASTSGGTVGEMSDSEFIATLNNLAQGGDDSNQASDDVSDMEMNNVPTARDIAEDVLRRTNKTLVTAAGVVTERSISESEHAPDAESLQSVVEVVGSASMEGAVPEDVCDDLDKVFERIDKMEWRDQKDSKEDQANVSDDSSDVEIVTNPVVPPAEQSQEIALWSAPPYIVYSRGGASHSGIGWNEEMRRFYNNSWRGDNFTLREAQQNMNRARHLWKIYTEDRFPKGRNAMSNLKCYNCCEFGHTRAKCKRPKKPMICYMCGESGHCEPRCPNTICLRCGNKTQVFTKSCNACTFQNRLICPVCKVRGHTINFCPDKWRRYHSTTVPNIYPDCRVEYKNRKVCCICGGRGHLPETCRSAVRFMEYPTIVSDIKSHQKSYHDISMKVHQSGIAVNLLYKPSEEIFFELAENTTPRNYYGRFLRAVGMGYMLNRKRKLSTMTPERYSKQARGTLKQYQSNAYGQSERTQDEVMCNVLQNVSAPEQVQEVSGSVNLDDDIVAVTIDLIDPNPGVDVETEPDTEPLSNEYIVVDEMIVPDTDSVGPNTNVEGNGVLGNNFKTPSEVHGQTHSSPPTVEKDPLPMDSDSNYSFSEHFEMASTSAIATATTNSDAIQQHRIAATATETTKIPPEEERRKPRHMEPLPDYIPLILTRGETTEEKATTTYAVGENVDLRVGISRRFISAAELNEESESRVTSPLPDLPCEAKIYLTHFHSNYLLSPEGNAFLVEKSKACDVEARLDWTSVGHVLIIFGLQSSQDHFHRELLLKYRELTDQMNRKRLESTKVPKRTDVLIRFLRDNITQLLTNLGNVNELQRRIKHLDKQNTKGGNKSADKARRSLNMILLGQAGVSDGNIHLDKLLLSLKTLINDYKSENVVPNSVRDEIDAHFKLIFTPYRHDNYPELIQTYNHLLMKNRIPKLSIDPILLGQRVLDTTLTSEQKERLAQQPTVNRQQKQQQDSSTNLNPKNIVPNPLNPKNSKLIKRKEQTPVSQIRSSSPPLPAPSMKMRVTDSPPTPLMKISNRDQQQQLTTNGSNNNINSHTIAPSSSSKTQTKTKSDKQSLPPSSFANPQQKSTVSTSINVAKRNLESAFKSLLTEEDDDSNGATTVPIKKGLVRAATSKGPSMFWSRESMKYLDECVKLGNSSEVLLQKLERVQSKAHAGLLSYNDYRAVIKVYSSMLGKKKIHI